MRVLTIIDSLGGGGIETILLRCIPKLREHGVEIVLAVHTDAGELRDYYKSQGCSIYLLPKTPNLIYYALRVKNIARRVDPDVIHSRMGYGGGGGVLGAWLANIPCVLSFHSTQPGANDWKKGIIRRLLRWCWLIVNRILIRLISPIIVGHSIATLDAFDRNWREKTDLYRYVPNGVIKDHVRLEREKSRAKCRIGVDATSSVLLHIGNMTEAKNHIGLVRIFASVLKNKSNAILILVGSGPYQYLVEKEVERLGIAENVQFRGFQHNTSVFYEAADLFLFPSIYEGFGNVLVEAQLHRVPIVASDIPAHREAVAPIQHEFLFPVNRLEDGVNLVLRHMNCTYAQRRVITEESFKYVIKRYSIQNMTNNLIQIYSELVNL